MSVPASRVYHVTLVCEPVIDSARYDSLATCIVLPVSSVTQGVLHALHPLHPLHPLHSLHSLHEVRALEDRRALGEVLRENVPAIAFEHVSEHLVQWACWHFESACDRVTSDYVFDEVYATRNPWVVNRRELDHVRAVVTAKLFDDGRLIAAHDAAIASLRWKNVLFDALKMPG